MERTMIKAIFITQRGDSYPVEAASGTSLMRAAVNYAVPGIDADCGGACARATCHVLIEPEWCDVTGAATEAELGLLELSDYFSPTSRLACQIKLEASLDGLTVRVPLAQF